MQIKLAKAILIIYLLGTVLTGGLCLWITEGEPEPDCLSGAFLWPLIAYELFIVDESCDSYPGMLNPCAK